MCRIMADLVFPQDEEFTGYHSDTVQIAKAGEEQVCYSGNVQTDWGCTHVGDAFIDGRRQYSFRNEPASVRIYDGKSATFKVGVSHRFSEDEVRQGLDYGDGRANLIVKINGQMQTQSFRHNQNEFKETHEGYDRVSPGNTNIGFVNPFYNGDYFVEIECDDQCQCGIVQKQADCRLKGSLKFPKIEDSTYYGYHSDV